MTPRLHRIFISIVVSVLTITLTTLHVRDVFAAGSLVVTQEPQKSSVTSSEANIVTLYGTTSGANTSGYSVRITVSGTTITDYDQSGTPFQLNSIVQGSEPPGSTTIVIGVGYTGLAGGSGKQLMGRLTLAATAPRTVQITSSEVDAYDANLDLMAGSGSSASYTSISPPVQPSVPSTPSQPSATPSSPSTPQPGTTTEPSDSPVPSRDSNKKTVVPTENGGTETLTEEEVTEILIQESPDAVAGQPLGAETEVGKKSNNLLYVVFATVTVIAFLAGLYMLLRKKRSNKLASPVASVPAIFYSGENSKEQSTPVVFMPEAKDKE